MNKQKREKRTETRRHSDETECLGRHSFRHLNEASWYAEGLPIAEQQRMTAIDCPICGNIHLEERV